MSEPGQLLTRSSIDRIEACVLDFERNPPPPAGSPRSRYAWRPPIRGILLQDLASEGTAQCAVSSRKPAAFLQKLTFVGEVIGNTSVLANASKFALSLGTAKTDFLPYNISAADLQAALEKLAPIGKGNVSVALGGIPAVAKTATAAAAPAMFPGVWLITFIGKFLQQTGPNPPAAPALMTVDGTKLSGLVLPQITNTIWGDSGVVETMNDVIPVMNPTPMRAGAVVVGLWMPGVGYCCVACEGREFSVIFL